MKSSSSKENILKKIKQALKNPVPVPFPESDEAQIFFAPSTKELELEFAENFSSLLGKFSFCVDERELTEQLSALIKTRNWTKIFCNEKKLKDDLQKNGFSFSYTNDLKNCDASITSCEQLIARTGSIVLTTTQQSGRIASVYAPVHICVANTNQLVYDVRDALQNVKEKYPQLPSLITLATGPSRTADIEKTLVVGVHGPKEVFCFLVEKK